MGWKIIFSFTLLLSLILTIAADDGPRGTLVVPKNESNSKLLNLIVDTGDTLLSQSLNHLNRSNPKYNINENNRHQDNGSNKNDYDCGVPRIQRIKRIIGGHVSSFGHHPWQVAIMKMNNKTLGGRPFCGGALLNDRWIITAAHCVIYEEVKSMVARLGELNVYVKKELFNYVDYGVVEKQVHPGYIRQYLRCDLALIKVDRNVHFDQHIIPVCLPKQDLNLIGRVATLTGWGNRKYNVSKSAPEILHEVDVEVFPNELCERWFSELKHQKKLTDGDLCAGSTEGGRDHCNGDSGGPLTTLVDGKRILIGVASSGFGCGRRHSPGLSMNVQRFLPWIRELIG